MTSFYVRDALGDQPGRPGTGAFSTCPDIIPAGVTPAPDPAQFTTAAGYATDYGGPVFLNQANFVYLRALSTGAPPANGRAWLYYTDSALALWPSQWRSDGIEVAGNPVNYQPVSATAQDQVCVTDLPFVWTPAPLPGNDHHCMIGWFENNPSNPPTSPVAGLGNFTSFEQLLTFILDNPHMGWRNVVEVSKLGPTWSQTSAITGPTPAAPFVIGVEGNNLPTDAGFSFMVPGPTPGIAPVIMPSGGGWVPISSPNFQDTVKVTDWPAGARSSITVNFKQGATVPPAGSSLTVVLSVPAATLGASVADRVRKDRPDLVKRSQPEPPARSLRPGAPARGGGREPGGDRGQTAPTEHVTIGAVTYRF